MITLILMLAAAAAQPTPRCAAGERLVYACPFGKSAVSVCATDSKVIYRHATNGKTDLAIASDGKDGRARQTRIVGGGGGHQTAMRFSSAGHDYIVYSAVYGTLTVVAGRRSSGLVVMRGDGEVSNRRCPANGKAQRIEDVPPFVPEETDPEREAWY